MVSAIDPTVPIYGTPTTASVRSNFQIAHDEISALQAAIAGGPFLPITGGEVTGQLQVDASVRIGATVDAGYKLDVTGTPRFVTPAGTPMVIAPSGALGYPAAALHPSALALATNSGGSAAIQLLTFGTFGPAFVGTAANGIATAPTAVTNGSTLLGLWGNGFDGTAWANGSSFFFRAAENWTATAHGTLISIGGTGLGSTSLQEWARFVNGDLLIGGQAMVDSGYRLDVRGIGRFDTYTGTGTLPIAGASTVLALGAPDGQALSLNLFGYGTAAVGRVGGYQARGTRAAPTATQSGDTMFALNALGYGATGFATNSRATFNMVATENWSDTAQGAGIAFRATPNGTIATAEIGRAFGTGNWSLGNNVDSGIKLDVTGSARFGTVGFNGTVPLAKPTIAGACAGNTAIKALLTALASYGLLTDTTTV